jgi:hypothetical protein
MKGWVLTLCVVLAVVPALAVAGAEEKKDETMTGKKGAGIGALLGLALGRGNIIEDTIRGAALGAAGGKITGEIQKSQRRNEEKASARDESASKEAELARREARIEALEAQFKQTAAAAEQTEAEIVEAIGPDNWEGYKALRGCHHARAYALAGAGATSSNPDHKLASLWLEAMTAVDGRDTKRSKSMYETLAAQDPEIDTVQQASLATDQAVLDMRAERIELGIGDCR